MHYLAHEQFKLSECKLPSRARIASFSDTHKDQVCGVTKSLKQMSPLIEELGFSHMLNQAKATKRNSIPLGKTGVWITWNPQYIKKLIKKFEKFEPDAAHVFTEGTIGLGMKRYFQANNIKHTSSFHTDWPSYAIAFARRHVNIGEQPALDLLWRLYESFHASSEIVMTRSETFKQLLESKGFKNVVVWNGGVDLTKFVPEGEIHPKLQKLKESSQKPVLLYLGRISDEKNIRAFLDIKLDAIKLVVGPITPYAEKLKVDYSSDRNIVFWGAVDHEKLPSVLRGVDLMVFPSRSDTFGLVNIEALACGVPVVGFRETCLKDIVVHEKTGMLADSPAELDPSVLAALELLKNQNTKVACIERANQFSIPKVTQQFISNLVQVK